jgi:hypothetical protein
MITIEIPVKAYIKTWIETQIGTPAKLSRENNIGKYLYQLMEDPTEKRDPDYRPYKEMVAVKITEEVFLRKGYYLTKTNVIAFNTFVEEQIKSTVFNYIDALIDGSNRIKKKEAIEKALVKFGFDEWNWPYQSVKKAYDRHCKRSKQLK